MNSVIGADVGGDPGLSGPSLAVDSAGAGSTISAFATETGGRAFVGAPDLSERLDFARQDLATYYSLGYQPQGKDPGNFHRSRSGSSATACASSRAAACRRRRRSRSPGTPPSRRWSRRRRRPTRSAPRSRSATRARASRARRCRCRCWCACRCAPSPCCGRRPEPRPARLPLLAARPRRRLPAARARPARVQRAERQTPGLARPVDRLQGRAPARAGHLPARRRRGRQDRRRDQRRDFRLQRREGAMSAAGRRGFAARAKELRIGSPADEPCPPLVPTALTIGNMRAALAVRRRVAAAAAAALLLLPRCSPSSRRRSDHFLDTIEVRVVNVDVLVLDGSGKPSSASAATTSSSRSTASRSSSPTSPPTRRRRRRPGSSPSRRSRRARAAPVEAPRAPPAATWIVYVDQSNLQPGRATSSCAR